MGRRHRCSGILESQNPLPICLNPQAAGRFARIFLTKTKTKAEIVAATASALDEKELPALEPGAMCYMMSKQRYLNDQGTLI